MSLPGRRKGRTINAGTKPYRLCPVEVLRDVHIRPAFLFLSRPELLLRRIWI